MYTPVHALVLKTPILMHATLTAKNTHAPMHARLCNCVETSLPWKDIIHPMLLAQEKNPNPR